MRQETQNVSVFGALEVLFMYAGTLDYMERFSRECKEETFTVYEYVDWLGRRVEQYELVSYGQRLAHALMMVQMLVENHHAIDLGAGAYQFTPRFTRKYV